MADSSMETPTRLFQFDSPRTCSQLFFKILASHPQLVPVHQPLASAAMYGPESYLPYLHRSERAEALRKDRNERFWEIFKDFTYAKAGEGVLDGITKIEAEGKWVYAKEHSHFLMKPEVLLRFLRQKPGLEQSITEDDIRLPLSLIDTLTPLFVFRHPALSVPSNWRTQILVTDWDIHDKDLPVFSSLQSTRMLFDFFWRRLQDGRRLDRQRPLILIEGDDVVHNTIPLMNVVCERLGLDSAELKYERERVEIVDSFVGYDSLLVNRYMSQLNASTGVEREQEPNAKDIDVDAEQQKWKAEFGESIALRLRELVDAEMPNYEYLRKHKIVC